MKLGKHITQDGSEVFYFDGGDGKEWVGYKKHGVGVWKFSPYNGSQVWYTREQYKDLYPRGYIPHMGE